MTVTSVWRAVTSEQNKVDRANHSQVRVTTRRPEDTDAPIVYEIHAPEDALTETDVEGEFLFNWADVEKYPYQVEHRGA
jgi:hypothetical protein